MANLGRISKEIRQLVNVAQKQGWTIVATNGHHLKWKAPTGAVVTTSKLPNVGTLKSIIKDLQDAGLIVEELVRRNDGSIVPLKTTVQEAMEAAVERRQRNESKVTPHELGEGRPEIETVQEKIVIVNPPKTELVTEIKVENVEVTMANPSGPKQYARLSEARVNGVQFQHDVELFFTDNIVCRVCGTEILSTSGMGPHLEKHRREMGEISPELAALVVLSAVRNPAPVGDPEATAKLEQIKSIITSKSPFDAIAAIAKIVGM